MSVSNSLDKFGKQVVKESKTDLTKKKKNASKELYNSIKYNFKEHKNSFHLSFEMSEHGKFLDKGVAGNNDPNFKGKKKTLYKSSAGYHFGDTVNFLIRRSIFQYGTKETSFFTKPFESAFKSLPEEVIKAYALEVDELFDNVFK